MHSRSSPTFRGPIPPALILALLLTLPAGLCPAQNLIDPLFSHAEALCDFNLLTVGNGTGDPLGDVGIVVHCYDTLGDPVAGIPGSAFDIINLSGTMVRFGTPALASGVTDDEGRIFLTGTLAVSATLVHGIIGVEVTQGGGTAVIDNGGAGIPVEFRTPDLNHDGIINLEDIVVLAQAYGCCDDTEACLQCDYDGDGCVSLADRVIFTDHFYGTKRLDAASFSPAGVAEVDTTLFAGCIQLDFDDDNDPATLRDEIVLIPGGFAFLKLVAKDFVCLTGTEFELVLPPGLVLLGSPSVLAPFTDMQIHQPVAGGTHLSMTAPYITSEPAFMCQFMVQSIAGGPHHTDDFVLVNAIFADCHEPPREVTACLGAPTPCEMSYLVQGSNRYISCPGDDLSPNDIITVVMRDQTGAPVPGLPAGGFRVTLHDELGSDRANTFSLTPQAGATDLNGELDFLFEPRGICRWPDACLDLRMNLQYEGCSLDIRKTVQTINIVRYVPAAGTFDLIDTADITAWNAARFTRNWCLDLVGSYRCPVVTQASINIAQAHYLHGCDVSGVPDSPGMARLQLHQNVPNPFNPATEIQLTLPAATDRGVLTVYDLRGHVVRSLWDGPLPEGTSHVSWNGRDANGRLVSSGVYLARFTALGRTESMRMALLR